MPRKGTICLAVIFIDNDVKLKRDRTITQKETKQLIDCCIENIDAVYYTCNNNSEIKNIEARPSFNVLTLLSQTKTLLEQLNYNTTTCARAVVDTILP